jgi:hypothetical protein
MPHSSQGTSPSQLLRQISSALLTDLGDGTDLLEITFALVLRNLLKNIRQCGSRVYPFLKIVVPYIVLLAGLSGSWAAARTAANTITSVITAPLTAQIVVPSRHPLNKDVLAWLSANRSGRGASSKAPTDDSTPSPSYDHDRWGKTPYASERPSTLKYIPNFGKYRFRFERYIMTMEKKDPQVRPMRCLMCPGCDVSIRPSPSLSLLSAFPDSAIQLQSSSSSTLSGDLQTPQR